MRPSAPMISYLYLLPGLASGMKISQKPLPRTRMGWRRPSHELKSPTTLTRWAFGANRECDARDLVHDHGMCTELFVEMRVGPFAEKIEIEIGQDWRETVGVFELDLPRAVARAHAVAARPVGQPAFEQSGVMNALEASFVALFIDDCDAFRIRKENTDEGYVAFDVGAEIPEGVGMATLDDGISLRRERTHSGVPSERKRMRQVPANGTRSQSG